MLEQPVIPWCDRLAVVAGSTGVILARTSRTLTIQPMLGLPAFSDSFPDYSCVTTTDVGHGTSIVIVDREGSRVFCYEADPVCFQPESCSLRFGEMSPKSIAFAGHHALVVMGDRDFREILVRATSPIQARWVAKCLSPLDHAQPLLLGSTSVWPFGDRFVLHDQILHRIHLLDINGYRAASQDVHAGTVIGMDENKSLMICEPHESSIRVSRLMGEALDRQLTWEGSSIGEIGGIACWQRGSILAITVEREVAVLSQDTSRWQRLRIPWAALGVDTLLHQVELERSGGTPTDT